MSVRGRSPSPRPINGSDTEMAVDQPIKNGRHGSRSQSREKSPGGDDAGPRVVVVQNLTRNVLESHVRAIFGHYGKIKKVDFPTYKKTGQTRGKAAMEYFETNDAAKAVKHMNGGQLDGAVLQLDNPAADYLQLDLFEAWAESVLTLVLVLDPALEAVQPSGDADQGPWRPAVLEVAALLDVELTDLATEVDVVDSTVATTAVDTEALGAGIAMDTAHPDAAVEEATQNLARLPLLDTLAADLLAMNVVEGGPGVEPIAVALAAVHRVVAAVGLVADPTRARDLVRTLDDHILPILEGVLLRVGVVQEAKAHLERGFAVAAEVLAAPETLRCRLVPALAVAINVVVAALDSRLDEDTRDDPFLDSVSSIQNVKPLYD